MLATLPRRCAPYLAAAALLVCATSARAEESPREVVNLAACYTEGIDAIGAGQSEAGGAIWHQCFSDDLSFEMHFGPAYSVTCPGEKCPFPATMNGLARRVALAKGTFERSGYVATSHHLTSLGIEFPQPGTVQIKAHLQAWHFRKDGTAVVGLGTWQVKARKSAAGWRIVEERLDSPLRVVIPKAE